MVGNSSGGASILRGRAQSRKPGAPPSLSAAALAGWEAPGGASGPSHDTRASRMTPAEGPALPRFAVHSHPGQISSPLCPSPAPVPRAHILSDSPMRSLQLGGLATLLGLSLLFSACSGGGGGSTGPMFIEQCSLGCSNGQGGSQVSCSVVNVGRNVEITVLFSEAVQLGSVNSGTFRIINTSNGSVPVGTYSLDPVNPRRLIFRPALTFDTVGNPIFALADNETYQVTIPGVAQGDPGPFIQSVGGKPNESRLQCTIRTTEGLLDPVPGAPVQHSQIVVKELPSGDTIEVFDPANGAVEVPTSGPGSGQQTVIRVVFDDIMNPATLANLSTGQSSTITVKIDPDGNTIDTSDQVDQAGTFSVSVDFANLRTILEFVPSGGFPSGGQNDDPTQPGNQEIKRLIVMTLPANLLDLVGNQLANPGQIIFRTETLSFQPIFLPQPTGPDDPEGEGFEDDGNHDVERSGARWGNGRLTYGRGGGSGRLGELFVSTNETLVLDTTSQTFPYPDQVRSLLDNSEPGVDYDPTNPASWPTLTVEDGAFEFTRIVVSSNGRLVLSGDNAARLFARGLMVVASGGRVDIAGASALPHVSTSGGTGNNSDPTVGIMTAFGGAGGAPGPNGGSGGKGGDRFDQSDNPTPQCQTTTMTNVGGIFIAPNTPTNPGPDNDGETGGGIGLTSVGAGQGGSRWPVSNPMAIQTSTSACIGGVEFVVTTNPTTGDLECRSPQVGGPGGGGGYALDGGTGIPMSPESTMPSLPGLTPTLPPVTPGGSLAGLLEPPDQPPMVRRLDFHEGNLRGGSGGGGGGAGIYGTKTNADANMGTPCFPNSNMLPYFDHSAAGGGGGGGALQATAGVQLVLNGFIEASGGDGGSSSELNQSITDCTNTTTDPDCPSFAAPGGGGSGGAVRLQSQAVQITQLPGRITVTGGSGGMGAGGSTAGAGSPGLVRIELPTVDESDMGQIAQLAANYAPTIAPYMPEAGTEPGGFNYPFLSGAFLSIGKWQFQRERPDSLSAGMSCWMKPQGNFFELEFLEDDETAPDDPDAKAWNMDIIYFGPSGEVHFPYRGIPDDPTFPLTGESFEEFLGSFINRDLPPGETGSLLSVRFQGARSTGSLDEPCNVQLSGLGAEIEAGSLTPWVRTPGDLNLFSPRPNMIRFVVVFEEVLRSQGTIEFRVTGVTNLKIGVQPN